MDARTITSMQKLCDGIEKAAEELGFRAQFSGLGESKEAEIKMVVGFSQAKEDKQPDLFGKEGE